MYESNLKKLDDKIEALEKKFIEGDSNKLLFDKYNLKYESEKKETASIIEGTSIQSSNLEKASIGQSLLVKTSVIHGFLAI